ncbi:hypothetical protein [Methylobacterium sp. PvR107]|uniref:hypothetical protein n=1 Tax=Methylobacterium sp. PvR107 TaxID=2806597 RepID=UPI001AEB6FF8|nr:hypothetical protein [Methylobacterium sp. PvR107]MBP1178857.1 hypothetical protein [Methylobacterium sp. PvR107]
MKTSLVALLVGLMAGAALAGEPPLRSRLCPENLPDGVRLPPQPGCDSVATRPKARRDGVYNFGNGTTVQIGGRASAEYGMRR